MVIVILKNYKSSELLLVTTIIMVFRQEMFYQIMMYEFGNFGVIQFSVCFIIN